MSRENSCNSTKYFINPVDNNINNNNFNGDAKDFETFNQQTICGSSDSDFINSSRSNSIDSDKSTESNNITVQLNTKTNNGYSSTNEYSDIKSKDVQLVNEVTDSGISSPTGNNFSNLLNLTKKETNNSYKEKCNEDCQTDLASADSSNVKTHSSKYGFRLPKLHIANHNSTNIGNIVTRIRSLSISMAYNPHHNNRRASGDVSSMPSEFISPSATTPEKESDPSKLPKEHLQSSINFTSKNLRSSRKWLRMTHSLSCDADSYNVQDFSATQNRLEKYLSGHLDASTPSGALLKVINQGLRKVSESDRYLLFSKSPLRSPIDFLESGIEHLGDTDMLISALHHSTCYDLMPESGKLVVFDSKIQIDKAFLALNDNSIDCAPVWCSTDHCYSGILTKEDQIYFLSLAYELNGNFRDIESYIEDLSNETVENCMGKYPLKYELQFAYPENTVASAIKQLELSPCNRALVLDKQRSGNALFVLDHGLILSFLLNTSKAGLPLPSELKTSVGVTELMLSRKSLDKYQVSLDSGIADLLKVMNDNPHHCALVCTKKLSTSSCHCTNDCVAVVTVDHINHLISTFKAGDPVATVESLLNCPIEINQKVIRCTESDAVIDVIKLINKEKAFLGLICPDDSKQCVHSLVSPKQLLDYIMKHDRERSSPRESIAAVEKGRNLRSVSCCEDSQRITDINLSEVSLDEKDEDVFNMEMI